MPDASGLFDLMRNHGGAIGLALIDTVIYGRSLVLGAAIRDRLQAGDFATAKSVGLPLDIFAQRPAVCSACRWLGGRVCRVWNKRPHASDDAFDAECDAVP